MRSVTRGFVLPRFGSRKPTPRWGGHKDRVSFNPFPLSNGPSDRVSFSSQITWESSFPQGPPHNWCLLPQLQVSMISRKNAKEKKRSKRKSSNEHYKSLSLVTKAFVWSWERIWSLLVCFAMNASSCIVVGSWKTWMQWMVGWLVYL